MTKPGPEPHGYDTMRAQIVRLTAPRAAGGRTVYWVDGHEGVGVARDESGHLELFIPGDELQAATSVVAGQMSYGEWSRQDGDVLRANRILLPAAPHYDAVAAFLCSELRTQGVSRDARRAFRRSEPVIEMILTQLAQSAAVVVGLLGELIALSAVIGTCADDRISDVVEAWRGHLHSARDVQLADVGLEVKTTRSGESNHPVQGTWQVEAGHVAAGHVETEFFLLSVGVELADGDDQVRRWSVAGAVDSVLREIRSRVPDDKTAAVFLERLRAYGDETGDGYDHATMSELPVYRQPWRTTFVRLYDMRDDGVLALRSKDLVQFSMVDPKSVSYTLRLPAKVRGDLNPVSGLQRAAAVLVTKAYGHAGRRDLPGAT